MPGRAAADTPSWHRRPCPSRHRDENTPKDDGDVPRPFPCCSEIVERIAGVRGDVDMLKNMLGTGASLDQLRDAR